MRLKVSISILASIFLLSPAALVAQVDSRIDWFDEDASQGENGWFYGYYNKTEDENQSDGVYQAADFIQFSEDDHWGDRLDMSPTPVWRLRESLASEHPPFTFIGQEDTHPNGLGVGAAPRDGHWTIRRYVYNEETQLVLIRWHTRKQDLRCGNGTCGHVFVNDDEVDSGCITFADDVGLTRELFVELNPGDTVDLALNPSGRFDFLNDGCDRSANWLTVTFPLPDSDDDGTTDDLDNCPDDPNGDQADGDEDGLGDVCDNCPTEANADQADRDSNDTGDVCDDGDEDGEFDASDNCPDTPNADQADEDNDNVGTLCDNCPALANTDQSDVDGDGTGDACDDELADSRADWSTDGIQGENNWFYGYYDLTKDQEQEDGIYQAADVIEFIKEDHFGERPDLLMLDSGPAWRLAPIGAPFTFLGRRDTHPNGTNATGDEHWTVRRYLHDGPTSNMQVIWFLRIGDQPCGGQPGVTGHVFVNDDELDRISIPGDNREGVERQFSVVLNPGDTVDLVLTPVGANGGDRFDSCDGSVNWMTLTQARGACCTDGVCAADVSQDDCEAGGGTFQGLDGDCGSVTCGTLFRRGDHDGSGAYDITDALNLLSELFLGTLATKCNNASDFDNSGIRDISDPLNGLAHLFLGTVGVSPPGPGVCGLDPTEIILAGTTLGIAVDQPVVDLDCEEYPNPEFLPSAACP